MNEWEQEEGEGGGVGVGEREEQTHPIPIPGQAGVHSCCCSHSRAWIWLGKGSINLLMLQQAAYSGAAVRNALSCVLVWLPPTSACVHVSTCVCAACVCVRRWGCLCINNMLANILASTQGRRCWRQGGEHRSCAAGPCILQPCTARGLLAPTLCSHKRLLLGASVCTESGCTCAEQT